MQTLAYSRQYAASQLSGRVDGEMEGAALSALRRRRSVALQIFRLNKPGFMTLCITHICTLTALLACKIAFGVDPIMTAEFEQLHSLIKPKASEGKWLEIPWLTSLWEARRKAASEGKPILLWEMDGHPLGCT